MSAMTDDEHEQQERQRTAEELSRELLKVVVGYDGAAVVLAISLLLQHIVEPNTIKKKRRAA